MCSCLRRGGSRQSISKLDLPHEAEDSHARIGHCARKAGVSRIGLLKTADEVLKCQWGSERWAKTCLNGRA